MGAFFGSRSAEEVPGKMLRVWSKAFEQLLKIRMAGTVLYWLFSLQTNAGKRAMALVRGKAQR